MRKVAAAAALSIGLAFVPAVAMATPPPEVGSVSGVRFWDRNEDGIQQQGEQGTNAGGVEWKVYLEKPSGERVADTSIQEDGSYTFENITAGDWVVVFHHDTLYMGTTPERVPVTVEADQNVVVNKGVKGGTITGTAWEDLNDDGQMQPEEPRLAGIEVYDSRGQRTTTDAEGNYIFADQTIDEHQLYFTPKEGMTFSRPGIGPPATDSDVIDADSGNAPATVSMFHGELLNPSPNGAGYVRIN